MKQQDSQPSSFLDEQKQSNNRVAAKKQPQQFKALFLKNLRLQSKQKGTNCCQIMTPILCIFFTYLMKTIAEQNLKVGAIFQPIYYPIKFNNLSYFDKENPNTRKTMQWVMYSCQNKCDSTILGENTGNGKKNGMLGQVQQTSSSVNFHPDPTNLTETIPKSAPFFLNKTSTDINQTINNQIYNRLQTLNTLNFSLIKRNGGFDCMPDGVYNISLLNQNDIAFDLKVKDVRELDMLIENGITGLIIKKQLIQNGNFTNTTQKTPYVGLLMLAHWITQTFIEQSQNKTLQSGVLFMPEDESGINFIDTIINAVAILIFPVSLSLLFPVFLYTTVLQKQQKLIQMMKMNGMKISSYWFVYFIFNFVLSLLTNTIFVLLGFFITKMRFFYQTDPLLIIIVLIGWSLAQIGLAVFCQTFLSKSRSANIIGYLISIWTSMIGSTISLGVYQYPNQLPYGLRLFAPFGFTRIIYLMLTGCTQGKCYGNIANIPQEMQQQIAFLYINFIFFFLVGTYLFQIVPQEFGVTRSPLFPFTLLKNLFKKNIKKDQFYSDKQIDQDYQLKQYIDKNDQDIFSKNQRSDILKNKNVIQENPLVINNLRKLYYKQGIKKMYSAVKSFNLKIGPTQTFGLLGPNGAGKTTLISMITGMFEPNYGNAWIGGYDIRTSIEKAQLQMGVCPQFDLLWPQLTVSEHLYFYARLKGVSSKQMDRKVTQAIQQVKLTQFKDFPSSSLSGGMKRRLSVAISLVGDPKIVFLDEPSTGLDPENRRQLWEVLAKCQKNRAIFITTHMMEQADALCNRVGIITKGVLRTVAPQVTLKKKYGGGYRLSISITKQQRKLIDRNSLHQMQKGNQIEDYIQANNQQDLRKSVNSFIQTQEKQKSLKNKKRISKILNYLQQKFKGTALLKQYIGYLIFKVPPTYKVSEIFQSMQKMQKQLQVADIAITSSSLQDVFMNVVKQHEVQSGNDYPQLDDLQRPRNSDDVFVSFPQSGNVNMTPNNSEQMNNQVASSIISKNRQSVMSRDKKNNSQYRKDYENAPSPNAKKLRKQSKDDDDEDYF